MTIIKAIVAEMEPELLNEEVEADEAYFGGRRRGKEAEKHSVKPCIWASEKEREGIC